MQKINILCPADYLFLVATELSGCIRSGYADRLFLFWCWLHINDTIVELVPAYVFQLIWGNPDIHLLPTTRYWAYLSISTVRQFCSKRSTQDCNITGKDCISAKYSIVIYYSGMHRVVVGLRLADRNLSAPETTEPLIVGTIWIMNQKSSYARNKGYTHELTKQEGMNLVEQEALAHLV